MIHRLVLLVLVFLVVLLLLFLVLVLVLVLLVGVVPLDEAVGVAEIPEPGRTVKQNGAEPLVLRGRNVHAQSANSIPMVR